MCIESANFSNLDPNAGGQVTYALVQPELHFFDDAGEVRKRKLSFDQIRFALHAKHPSKVFTWFGLFSPSFRTGVPIGGGPRQGQRRRVRAHRQGRRRAAELIDRILGRSR